MSTQFIELLCIYNSNPWSDLMLDHQNIPIYIQKNTIFETLCIPQQYSPDFIKLIIEKLYIPTFNDTENCPDLYKTYNFIRMIEAILKNPPCNIITPKKLSQQMRFFNKEYIKEFLVHFSQHANEVNNQFNDILKNTTLGNAPLIQLSEDKFFFVSAHFCGYAFCEKIYNTIKPNYKKRSYDGALGDNLELLVKDLLDKKGYPCQQGIYAPKKPNEQGECDLVLETDKKLVFVEIKNCGLPCEFEVGDVITVLNFLGMGMLNAQKQGLHHKLYLEKNNTMELFNDVNDTTPVHTLSINNKRIHPVSLCSTEYAFLTAGTIANQLSESLIHATYNTHDKSREKELKKLNDVTNYIRKLAEEYALIKNGITSRDLFFETSFKSFQQFWVVLNRSSSLENFIDNLVHDTH
jgi:hypothetical protein